MTAVFSLAVTSTTFLFDQNTFSPDMIFPILIVIFITIIINLITTWYVMLSLRSARAVLITLEVFLSASSISCKQIGD